MRRIVKSGAGSAAVHAAAIGGFLLFDLGAGNQPITIDLTIMAAETMPSDAEPAKPVGVADAPAPSAPAPSPSRVRHVRRAVRTAALVSEVLPRPGSSAAEPRPEHEDGHPESEKTESQPSPASSGSAPAGPSRASGPAPVSATGAGSGEQGLAAQQAYLARHFAYIREAIQRNAAYPPLARRMGWVGRVVLAFRILADGSVANVRITKGAGFPVLDNGALEAVRRAAPFPRPPAEAEIVVPVAYALE